MDADRWRQLMKPAWRRPITTSAHGGAPPGHPPQADAPPRPLVSGITQPASNIRVVDFQQRDAPNAVTWLLSIRRKWPNALYELSASSDLQLAHARLEKTARTLRIEVRWAESTPSSRRFRLESLSTKVAETKPLPPYLERARSSATRRAVPPTRANGPVTQETLPRGRRISMPGAHLVPLGHAQVSNLSAWIRALVREAPGALYEVRLNTPVHRVTHRIVKAAAASGFTVTWDTRKPVGLRFWLTPLWAMPTAAGSPVPRPGKPAKVVPAARPPSLALACQCSVPLTRIERIRLVAECLAAALLPKGALVHQELQTLRSWKVREDADRIILLPPNGIRESGQSRLVEMAAAGLRRGLAAAGLTCTSVPTGGENWIIEPLTVLEPSPNPGVPLARFLEFSWMLHTGGQLSHSALFSATSPRVHIVTSTVSRGTSSRLRWTAQLGKPSSWTKADVDEWRHRTMAIRPHEASALAAILQLIRMDQAVPETLQEILDEWLVHIEEVSTQPPSGYNARDWLGVATDAVADPARRPALVALLAEQLGAVYAYLGKDADDSYLVSAPVTAGGIGALTAASRLGNPWLVPLFWPRANETYVNPRDWFSRSVQPRLSDSTVAQLKDLSAEWTEDLRTRRARGARGPHQFVAVEQFHLRQAGLETVAVLTSTAADATVRLQLSGPLRVSLYEFTPSAVMVRLNMGAYTGSPLRMVLDCFLLALLYDMCVAGALYTTETSADPRPGGARLLGGKRLTDEIQHCRLRPVSYLPDRGRPTITRDLGGSHASPASHDVTWFIRRLPAGFDASEEAKRHAQRYGVVLRRGETFVLPHTRGRSDGSQVAGCQLRSTHAVAEFERAFWH